MKINSNREIALNNQNTQNIQKKKGKKSHKKSHKKSFFKKGLLIYIITLLVAFVVIWVVLWSKLSDYQTTVNANNEAAQKAKLASREPQLCFQEKAQSMTTEDWINILNDSLNPNYNKPEDIARIVDEEITNAQTTIWESAESTEEKPIFILKNEDKGFYIADFILSKENEKWGVSRIELQLDLSNQLTNTNITVPESCQVSCNGYVVDTALALQTDSFSINGYEDSLNNPFPYVTYTIENLLSEPELSVSSSLDEYNIATDKDGNYFLCLNDGGTYQAAAKDFIDSLLYYYSMGKNSASSNMATALNKVASGSTAASIIKQSLDGVTWRQPSNITYETSYSDTFIIADNCYFVDISYKDSKSEDDVYEIYRVYFLDIGNGFKIYNFEMK